MSGVTAPMLPVDDVSRAWWDLNDIGNAQRFVSRHQGRFLYVRAQGWFAYDGKSWSREGAEARALLAAEDTARAIKDEAKALFDAAKRFESDLTASDKVSMYKTRGVLVKEWAETSGGVSRLKAMLTLSAAKLESALDEFDADPLALNCQNGTLRFFKPKDSPRWHVRLDDHNPSDKISRVAEFAFVKDAPSALWDKHLARSFPDSAERRFLMRSIGYSALGLMSEQCFFIWQGRGGDGKSVTANAVRRVLGGYAAKVDVRTFLEDKTGRSAAAASPDIARLAGATRFVVASEPPKGAKLNEALVKEFTGGVPLLARNLNQAPFEFKPAFKLTIDCNPLPGIGGADDGIWRRVVLISWREQLKREDMDTQIEDKLVAEGEGVLARIVEGALAYLDRHSLGIGLDPPETIRAAGLDYKSGSNTFREWLDGFCVFDAAAATRQSALYASYKDEQERQGQEKYMSQISFGRALADMQALKFREAGTGQIMRRGVRLASDEERFARLAAAPSGAPAAIHKPSQSIRDEGAEARADDADAEAFRYEGN